MRKPPSSLRIHDFQQVACWDHAGPRYSTRKRLLLVCKLLKYAEMHSYEFDYNGLSGL